MRNTLDLPSIFLMTPIDLALIKGLERVHFTRGRIRMP
jgi:hypothetical protein